MTSSDIEKAVPIETDNRHSRAAQAQLIRRLASRNIAQKYRDTALGALWSLVSPLILLVIYTLLFSVIFETKWTGEGADDFPYALLMFSGIIFFTLYSEVVNTATGLVQGNAQLIKRTQVDARILPLSSALSSVFTLGLNFLPFLGLYLILVGLPPATALLLPVLMVPLLILSTGVSLFVAAIATYVRDIQQLVPLITTATLFLSPIFFSLETIPPKGQTLVKLFSPLGVVLPASKDLLFFGRIPNLSELGIYSVVAVVIFALGWRFYSAASRGFADVV